MRKLAFGEYQGDVLDRVEHESFLLTRTAHEPRLKVEEHVHASAYYCLVLRGGFIETSVHGRTECGPGTLVFHPHPDPHEDQLLPEGSICLNIQLPREASVGNNGRSLTSFGGPLCWLATRLLVQSPSEELVGLLAAETARRLTPRKIPHLVRRANRLLEHAGWKVSELAGAVDTHPVYLARLYREAYGHTLKEHLIRNRLGKACMLLAAGKGSLAEIAVESGFFDQSHLTTAFHARVGLTPAEFRRCYS